MILLFVGVLVLLRLFYVIAEAYYERDWPRSTWSGLAVAIALLVMCVATFG